MMTTISAQVTSLKHSPKEHTQHSTKEGVQCSFPEKHLGIKRQEGAAVLLFICMHGKKTVFFLTGARATSLKETEEGVAF